MVFSLRNIQGTRVELTLVEVSPYAVKLDPGNPRIGFSMRQLSDGERNEGACTLLLTSQEDTEALRRSIVASNGVQEPIYVRADGRVAEGNRRVVAVRAASEQFPEVGRFTKMPAWLIPESTPEHVIQDLLNEVHLGSVRGWAPYERGLQMKALVDGGLIEEEIAERYRMETREVRQHLAAIEFMNSHYFPITADPADAEHRTKFSYFLEYYKNGRIQSNLELFRISPSDLRAGFGTAESTQVLVYGGCRGSSIRKKRHDYLTYSGSRPRSNTWRNTIQRNRNYTPLLSARGVASVL